MMRNWMRNCNWSGISNFPRLYIKDPSYMWRFSPRPRDTSLIYTRYIYTKKFTIEIPSIKSIVASSSSFSTHWRGESDPSPPKKSASVSYVSMTHRKNKRAHVGIIEITKPSQKLTLLMLYFFFFFKKTRGSFVDLVEHTHTEREVE